MNRRTFFQSASAALASLCFWRPKAKAEDVYYQGVKLPLESPAEFKPETYYLPLENHLKFQVYPARPTLNRLDEIIDQVIERHDRKPRKLQLHTKLLAKAHGEILNDMVCPQDGDTGAAWNSMVYRGVPLSEMKAIDNHIIATVRHSSRFASHLWFPVEAE